MKKWMIVVLGLCLMGSINTAQSNCTGSVTRETYISSWLGQSMYYTVYTPPQYDATEQYPTLYLMHGSNDDDNHWIRLGLAHILDEGICSGAMPPVIAVLPFGNVIANRNRFDTVSWNNVFITELVPDVAAKYALDPNRAVLGGISRGGFWAYQIGLRFPDRFQAIGGHSAFFDLYHAEPADNPLDLIQSAPHLDGVRLWLDRGVDDYARDGLDLMNERMTARGLPHLYTIYPQGEHNNGYWEQHIAEYVAWYVQAWQTATVTPTPVSVNAFVTNTPNSALPVPAIITSTPMPVMTPSKSADTTKQGLSLFVPVVAFPSIQTTLTRTDMVAIAQGGFDARVIIDDETETQLRSLGITIHPNIRRVAITEIETTLWQQRDDIAIMPFDRLAPQLRVLWVDDVPLFNQLEDYPLALLSPTPNFDDRLFTRLTLSGVTALARNTLESLDRNGIDWAQSGIGEYVRASDFFHISNEVSFADQCPRLNADVLGGATSFCSKQDHFELLKALDVDVVELSGNHNNDYNYAAYRQTLSWYQANDMLTVGGGATLDAARQPLLFTHNGSTVGWVSCNFVGPYYALANNDPNLLGGIRPGAAGCDWAWLEITLTALRPQGDFLIVSVQQQEVEDYRPLPIQQTEFRRLADMGADVVIGTAAHKPQIFEFYRESFIHYGLGNLFFDQPFWGNMRFFMDTLLLYDGKLMGVELFAGIIDDSARPRLMTAEERRNFLYFMLREQNGF